MAFATCTMRYSLGGPPGPIGSDFTAALTARWIASSLSGGMLARRRRARAARALAEDAMRWMSDMRSTGPLFARRLRRAANAAMIQKSVACERMKRSAALRYGRNALALYDLFQKDPCRARNCT